MLDPLSIAEYCEDARSSRLHEYERIEAGEVQQHLARPASYLSVASRAEVRKYLSKGGDPAAVLENGLGLEMLWTVAIKKSARQSTY